MNTSTPKAALLVARGPDGAYCAGPDFLVDLTIAIMIRGAKRIRAPEHWQDATAYELRQPSAA